MSDDNAPAANPAAPGSSENELIAIRKEKIDKLRALGINPFGGRFEISDEIGALRNDFAEGKRSPSPGA